MKNEVYTQPVVEVTEVVAEQGYGIYGSAPDSDDSEFG